MKLARLHGCNQPRARLKASYGIINGCHDFERPKKYKKLYLRKNGNELNIVLCLRHCKELIGCIGKEHTENLKIARCTEKINRDLDDLIVELIRAENLGRSIRTGYVAKALISHTELRNRVAGIKLNDHCSDAWRDMGLTAVMTWNF